MNRNQLIGKIIGTTVGYGLQAVVVYKISQTVPGPSLILLKSGTKYLVKLVKYTSKNYSRTDFQSEAIFSDAIDASLEAF